MHGDDPSTNKGATEFPLNGERIAFDDIKVTGREVLTAADLTPASEHQLILVFKGRTHLIEDDDEVDLAAKSGGHFRAFRGDRSYSFTVNEVSQVWGDASLEVKDLLGIVHLPEGHEFVLERTEEHDVVLRADGVVDLDGEGVEHIVSRPAHHRPDTVAVTVLTTAGTYPAEGAVRVPSSTALAEVLSRAADKLEITDTTGWVPMVGGRDLDRGLSFLQLHLSGEVRIDWGPPEGGGGAHA